MDSSQPDPEKYPPLQTQETMPRPPTQDLVPAVVVSVGALRYLGVRQKARFIKWMAILDCFICLLFVLSGIYFLLALICLPILGYFAGRNYNGRLCIAYAVYLVVMLVLRTVLIIVVEDLIYTVVQTLVMFVEAFSVWVLVRFYKETQKLSPEEIKWLKDTDQGVASLPPQV